jgi:hypothetical protein
MKTINISNSAQEIINLLQKAKQEELLIKLTDGSEFILTAIDDFDREIALTRHNKKLMDFLSERAKESETISLEEIERELGLD